MRYAAILLLAGLPLFGGCVVVRETEVIDYRPSGSVNTTAATRDASYRLYAPDANHCWIATDVAKGEPVGFREEVDGSIVAFASKQSWTVDGAQGRHVWLCEPKPAYAL